MECLQWQISTRHWHVEEMRNLFQREDQPILSPHLLLHPEPPILLFFVHHLLQQSLNSLKTRNSINWFSFICLTNPENREDDETTLLKVQALAPPAGGTYECRVSESLCCVQGLMLGVNWYRPDWLTFPGPFKRRGLSIVWPRRSCMVSSPAIPSPPF